MQESFEKKIGFQNSIKYIEGRWKILFFHLQINGVVKKFSFSKYPNYNKNISKFYCNSKFETQFDKGISNIFAIYFIFKKSSNSVINK